MVSTDEQFFVWQNFFDTQRPVCCKLKIPIHQVDMQKQRKQEYRVQVCFRGTDLKSLSDTYAQGLAFIRRASGERKWGSLRRHLSRLEVLSCLDAV